MPAETFQNHDLNFKVAVQDLEIATHRVQKVHKVDLRTAPEASGDMHTDDEDESSLSQAIASAISGVNIAVLNANGDAPESAAADAEHAAMLNSLKDLWVELKTHGGNEDAGQKLVMEWYSTLERAKTSGLLRATTALRTTPYGPNARPLTTANLGTDNDRSETGATATVGTTS